MTDSQIVTRDAGRDLDALVAERVMGWENNYDHPTGRGFPHLWGTMGWDAAGKTVRALNCPAYSDDISAAWEVVEMLDGAGARSPSQEQSPHE